MCGLMAGRGRVALATRSGIRPLASGHDLRVDMHRKAIKSPHVAAVISSRRPRRHVPFRRSGYGAVAVAATAPTPRWDCCARRGATPKV
jgi:hypothetical protein